MRGAAALHDTFEESATSSRGKTHRLPASFRGVAGELVDGGVDDALAEGGRVSGASGEHEQFTHQQVFERV